MLKRGLHITALLIVLLAALTPLAETVDTWDHDPNPAHDTELQLTAWFTGLGVVLTVVLLTRAVGKVLLRCTRFLEPRISSIFVLRAKPVPESGAGPPLTSPLRI